MAAPVAVEADRLETRSHMELRCPANVLFGIVSDGASGTIEVACKGKWCGKRPGVAVRHRFDLSTGKIVDTSRFQDPEAIFQKASKEQRKCL